MDRHSTPVSAKRFPPASDCAPAAVRGRNDLQHHTRLLGIDRWETRGRHPPSLARAVATSLQENEAALRCSCARSRTWGHGMARGYSDPRRLLAAEVLDENFDESPHLAGDLRASRPNHVDAVLGSGIIEQQRLKGPAL